MWLNTPRRPQEASGTCGQKVLLNGGLNSPSSTAGGPRPMTGSTGSPSATARPMPIPSVQDERDYRALIETLTNEVVPLYYTRDGTGLPRGWIARQKNAFRTLGWRFNADRMVMDYVQHGYLPAAGGLSCSMRRS